MKTASRRRLARGGPRLSKRFPGPLLRSQRHSDLRPMRASARPCQGDLDRVWIHPALMISLRHPVFCFFFLHGGCARGSRSESRTFGGTGCCESESGMPLILSHRINGSRGYPSRDPPYRDLPTRSSHLPRTARYCGYGNPFRSRGPAKPCADQLSNHSCLASHSRSSALQGAHTETGRDRRKRAGGAQARGDQALPASN